MKDRRSKSCIPCATRSPRTREEAYTRILETAQRREDGCLIPTMGNHLNGYRRVLVGGRNGDLVLIHRLAFEIEFGVTLSSDVTVDHTCHNIVADNGLCDGGPTCRHRPCIRPQHLAAAGAVENWRRGTEGTPRINRSKTHCPDGHPYDETNTYTDPKTGWRTCRTCRRIQATERRHRSGS